MPQYSAGKPTTKSLNTGANGSIPTLSQATGYVVYATTASGTTLYLQSTTPNNFSTNFLIGAPIVTGLGQAPTNGLGGTQPPPAPTLSAGGSGFTLPAGTYTIGVAYVTAAGYSVLSPTTNVVVTSGQAITVTAPPIATTGFVTVFLNVPQLEDWHVTRYAVLVTPTVSIPTVTLYVDSITPINVLDSTALGAQNAGNSDLYLRPGQQIIAQWMGADLGASCTLSVFGEKTS